VGFYNLADISRKHTYKERHLEKLNDFGRQEKTNKCNVGNREVAKECVMKLRGGIKRKEGEFMVASKTNNDAFS
jgi:hypothetical protein